MYKELRSRSVVYFDRKNGKKSFRQIRFDKVRRYSPNRVHKFYTMRFFKFIFYSRKDIFFYRKRSKNYSFRFSVDTSRARHTTPFYVLGFENVYTYY